MDAIHHKNVIIQIKAKTIFKPVYVFLPSFVYQGRTVVSAACSCRNKHDTCDENGFVNLLKKITVLKQSNMYRCFAVLGQTSADISTSHLYSNTKCPLQN